MRFLVVGLLVAFGLVTALVAGEVPAVLELDRRIGETFHAYAGEHPALAGSLRVLTDVFSPWALRAAALVLVVVLIRRHARRTAAWVAVTMIAGGLLNALLKVLVTRDRPAWPDPLAEAAGYAFPSGHAMNAALAATVALVLLHRAGRAGPAVWAVVVLIPLVTGVTRIGLGVHWSTDVLAGWLLGVAFALLTAMVFDRRPAPERAAVSS